MGEKKPHIVLCGGGSGQRTLTTALVHSGARVTRLVPAWDSGGSSRPIRQKLAMLSIGDVRQALMTLAQAEGKAGHVVRIFNTRLPDDGDAPTFHRLIDYYIRGEHPLMRALDPDLRAVLSTYLSVFQQSVGAEFDFRRGSLGNFILTGAFLTLDRDINAAIVIFRRLCGIEGHVWPSSTDDDLTLDAVLTDGTRISEQHRITGLETATSPASDQGSDTRPATRTGAAPRIAHINLHRGSSELPVTLNTVAGDAIASADAVVFGPGSFFTSILPHLHIPALVAAIALQRHIPRILVGNMLECRETRGVALADMAARLAEAGGGGCPTHVLANHLPIPFVRSIGGARYVEMGALVGDATWMADDFEDPWQRGTHDAARIAERVMQLARR